MRPCTRCLVKLLSVTLLLLVGTVVTSGFSVLLGKLGDDVAASVFGWIAAALGALLLVCFISLVFASTLRQIFSEIDKEEGENSDREGPSD